MPDALQFLVLTVAGWVNRHQEDLIDYLREENRILPSNVVHDRFGSVDAQRRRLAVRGKRLGRRALVQVAGIVTPDTILRWYRKLILADSRRGRHVGAPDVVRGPDRLVGSSRAGGVAHLIEENRILRTRRPRLRHSRALSCGETRPAASGPHYSTTSLQVPHLPATLAHLSVSNSSSGRHWELDQVPAVRDPTHIVQIGSRYPVSNGERQWRVALQ